MRFVVGMAAWLVMAAATPETGSKVVFSERSDFGRVLVVEEDGMRILRFDSEGAASQSAYDPAHPHALPLEYVRYALLGVAAAPAPRRILMIGLGGGSFTRPLHARLGSASIDVVEVNPVVVRVAREYFDVKEDARLRIHVADGRVFLHETRERWDVVFIDAYSGEGIPRHLRDDGFFSLAREHVAPGGVLVANLAASDAEDAAITGTMRSVLGPLACWRTPEDGNLIVVARPGADLPSGAALRLAARRLGRDLRLDFDLASLAAGPTRRTPPACGALAARP